MTDGTIVALVTPPGRGGLAVVRLSGPDAFRIAQSLLERPVTFEPRRGVLARIAVSAPSVAPIPVRSTRPERPVVASPPVPPTWSLPPRSAVPPAPPVPPASQDPSNPPNPPINRDTTETRNQETTGGGVTVIDEAVVLPFAAGASYTGEPVVEISVHGSMVIAGAVVQAAVDAGARPAAPGEFTLRAFLHGRLDLAQAEAVRDLVEAATPLQARVAFDQLTGTLSGRLSEIEQGLFTLSARLEASIDFPDEGYRFVDPGEVQATVRGIRERVATLIGEGRQGRLVREGITVAIVGRTNVGKSTLFNRLVGHDRAIVTSIPGTTRDVLTEVVTLEGLRVTLVDTAGVRESRDPVEQEGVARAGRARAAADLSIVVLDGSSPLESEDLRLLEETVGSPRVVVRNKADLPRAAWGPRLGSTLLASSGAELGSGDVGGRETLEVGKGLGSGGVGGREALDVGKGLGSGDVGGREALDVGKGLGSGDVGGSADALGAPPDEGTALVALSGLNGDGVDDLIRSINRIVGWSGAADPPALSNPRHIELLTRVDEALGAADELLANAGAGDQVPEELLLADLQRARAALEEVTGRRTTEDLLGEIFSKFCVGK